MNTAFFLGVDVGGTKTHALVTDQAGRVLGFGRGGPGNHELVGYPGLIDALRQATDEALATAELTRERIAGAGFGVAGYDWPSERQATLQAIACLNLEAPFEAVNDALIGLLAGSAEGWGVAVVSGTGSNCRGWDRYRQREGMVTSGGLVMGEGAGSSELVGKAMQAISHQWTRRGPATQLTPALVAYTGAKDLSDLLEGLLERRYILTPSAAPVIFQVAAEGDPVALDLIRWAGCELGELANCVIRQLDFQDLEFDVVQVGSMYAGSPLLTETMRETIEALAPGARLVGLTTPPVVGAVLLGMEQTGILPSAALGQALARSVTEVQAHVPAESI